MKTAALLKTLAAACLPVAAFAWSSCPFSDDTSGSMDAYGSFSRSDGTSGRIDFYGNCSDSTGRIGRIHTFP